MFFMFFHLLTRGKVSLIKNGGSGVKRGLFWESNSLVFWSFYYYPESTICDVDVCYSEVWSARSPWTYIGMIFFLDWDHPKYVHGKILMVNGEFPYTVLSVCRVSRIIIVWSGCWRFFSPSPNFRSVCRSRSWAMGVITCIPAVLRDSALLLSLIIRGGNSQFFGYFLEVSSHKRFHPGWEPGCVKFFRVFEIVAIWNDGMKRFVCLWCGGWQTFSRFSFASSSRRCLAWCFAKGRHLRTL